jgi:hypothetical protein
MKQRIVVSTFSLGLSAQEDFPAQRRKDAESEPSAAGGLPMLLCVFARKCFPK